MVARQKLLLLDDDGELLTIYQEMLARLPSRPDIVTATSGARTLALLESEPFTALLCDLRMPKMDGLQVLAIVRSRFPQVRTVAMTAISNDEMRSRAYAMGVDLYLEKPKTPKEITFFLDCIESLLGKQETGGFRGIQSKSLVDIIQLEHLSRSSSVLRIHQASIEGKIWMEEGEVVDAACQGLTGVEAFQKILSWKQGNFELLPAEPDHPRTILRSCQGLLLETAQALDESQEAREASSQAEAPLQPASPLAELGRFNGVEFVCTLPRYKGESCATWGAAAGEQIVPWICTVVDRFRTLGEALPASRMNWMEAWGPVYHVIIASSTSKADLCVGFNRSLSPDLVRETMKSIVAKWVS